MSIGEDAPAADRRSTGVDRHSTGVSASSRKYDLDEHDTSSIFVYRVRGKYEITTQKKLCEELDKNPTLRCSRKRIPRGSSRVEVRHGDTLTSAERKQYRHYPSMKAALASVGLPTSVYWRRLLMNQFQDLYIVSPDSSPTSSVNDSPEPASTDTSPSQTFDMSSSQ